MGARTKARKRAVDILFEADQRSESPLAVLARRTTRGDVTTNPYTTDLVEGVVAHGEDIDSLLSENSVDWSLERMPAVDRSVLRLAVFELMWSHEVPDPVVIDEAVELVKNLSTDDSPNFVNGLLARVLELKLSAKATPGT